jgi:hypothetical protein
MLLSPPGEVPLAVSAAIPREIHNTQQECEQPPAATRQTRI